MKTRRYSVCLNCGKEFELARAHKPQTYCSIVCKWQAQRKNRKIVCKTCGKLFDVNWQGSRRKYCSHECNNKAKDTRITVNCAVCGKSYLARPHDLKNGIDKYCSNECRYASKRDKRIVVCKTCGKEFETVKSELTRRGGIRYCSQKCAFENPDYKAHGKCRGGKRSDIYNIYFRSSWEANYARILEHLQSMYLIKSWKYEADCFDVGIGNYYPDFRLELLNNAIVYHEVKGYNHPTGKKKLEAFISMYPDKPITLIDEKLYKNLSGVYSDVIPTWERT